MLVPPLHFVCLCNCHTPIMTHVAQFVQQRRNARHQGISAFDAKCERQLNVDVLGRLEVNGEITIFGCYPIQTKEALTVGRTFILHLCMCVSYNDSRY